ncbi:MAG TPA: hypothetical protein PKN85_08240 [Syntrophorhabdaceae bacterium]|nr:hypothetical protein [Syntrophorhabdaceae bacterium]HOD74532.1 hypothetical protein [Syntrophorhabdaceae bacterium]
MRKRPMPAAASVLIVVLLLLAAASVGAFPGEPDGYNGIPWGTPLESLTSMEYAGPGKDSPGTALYRRVTDDLTFGKARLTRIEYGFVAGRLTAVTLKVDSLLQYLLMKEEAVRRFGPGTEADPRAERLIWEGDSTTIRLVSAFDLS